VIATLNFADLGTNCLDYTGSLVAEYHRPHRYAPFAAYHVIIGAAQTDGRDAHQNLGVPWWIERDALDRH
jgi:hypothetical protein